MRTTRKGRLLDAVAPLYGWLLTSYAVVALLLALVPVLRRPLFELRVLLDIVLLPLPLNNAAWAVALALLAAGIFARKRLAWIIVVALTTVVNVFNLIVLARGLASGATWGLYLAGALVQTVILVVLLLARDRFRARVRPGAIRRAVLVYVVGIILATAAGTLLLLAVPAAPGRTPLHPDDAPWWALDRVAGFSMFGPSFFDGHPPMWVGSLLGLLGAIVLVAAVFTLLRSQHDRNALSGRDEEALRAMLARWGDNDSLGYFATRRDKSVVYAPTGLAAVTYRTEIGVALASGDPVGDPEHWDGAIEEFLARAECYGWSPAVMGASREGARAWRRHGLTEIHLGDEAVLDCSSYRITGPDRKSVRQAVHRARNAGVEVRIRRHSDVEPAEFIALTGDVDRWRDTTDERGFSMALGRLGDPADGDCLLVEALHDGERVAVLSFSPWGRTGASLDLMRRSPQAPNGCVELMVTELCDAADEIGITRVSLNFAVFRSVFASEDELGVGPLVRVWRGMLVFLSRFWQMEALYRSNDRYGPEWVPRYLCYQTPRSALQVSIASGIAEGFIPWPEQRRLRDIIGAEDHSPGALAAYAAIPEILAGRDRVPERRIPEQTGVRMRSAERMRAEGRDPWPVAEHPANRCDEVAGAAEGSALSVAGRVMARRDFGGVVFLDVRDFTGDCQVILERDTTAAFDLLDDVDLADLIFAEGVRGASRSGEPSLLASRWTMEAKSLHPLPDKRRGLRDPEARARNRHVDLATGEDSRRILRARSAVLHTLRTTLVEEGFLEVETPILQQIHGGANARPFRTHINAYDADLYLRIAPELYLKRLMCGGVDRVFELGRTFRNEGVDATHNPEFTILEAYAAHGDYETMRRMCQTMIQRAAIAANGTCAVPGPDGEMVDISGDWPVKTLHQAVTEALRGEGVDCPDLDGTTDVEVLRGLCDAAGVLHRPDWDAGQVALEMYEHLVEDRTKQPTFYTDFPLSVSPLTRTHRSSPGVTERWDLVAWGVELGTAYTELTDPVDQRRRLEEQSWLAAGGDPEAMEVDEDFLRALEFGMPPTGGLGMGVDRVVMLITGATIRESLPFPFVRAER